MATFAERLCEALQTRDMNAAELSKITKISEAQISSYKKGLYKANQRNVEKLAHALNVSIPWLMGLVDEPKEQPFWHGTRIGVYPKPDTINIGSNGTDILPIIIDEVNKAHRIPVLGNVPAGTPLEAITDIIDYEEISPALAACGEYFALRIKGDSMAPRICEGDVVIVRKESAVDNGDVAIVLVNGNEATCKEIKFSNAGLTLIGWNVADFSPMFFTKEEVETMPVRIIGRVVEVRIKNLKHK